MPTTRAGRAGYEPALDGLRALAIIAVLLYHEFGLRVPGGFLGVDVFFVLSGYLITSLLLAEHDRNGRISLSGFWTRRARRLLPALAIFLLLVAGYSALVAPPQSLDRLRSDSIASMFYAENYWAAAHSLSRIPVGHMWSLAVEAQFYLVWPLVFGLLLWFTRRRPKLLLIAIALLVAASAVSTALRYSDASFPWLYIGTEARAQELLIGALLAVALAHAPTPRSSRARAVVEILGLVALAGIVGLVTVAHLRDAWLYRGGMALIAAAVAAIIFAAIQPQSPILGRALSVRPLVVVGVVSYGLYLFHEPINFMLNPNNVALGEWPLFGLRLAVLAAITVASFFLVERPLQRLRLPAWQSIVLVTATTAVVLVAVLATTRGGVGIGAAGEAASYRRLANAAPPESRRVFVVGDWLAQTLQPVGTAFSGEGVYGVTNPDWCAFQATGVRFNAAVLPSTPCGRSRTGLRLAISAFRPNVTILIMGTQEVLDRSDHGRNLPVGSRNAAAFFARQLEALRTTLPKNAAPLFVATVPCMRVQYVANPTAADAERRIDWVNNRIRQYARLHPDSVRVIEFGRFLCPDGKHRSEVIGESLDRADGLGASSAGTQAIWRWLATQTDS